jgi:hypothetical protein
MPTIALLGLCLVEKLSVKLMEPSRSSKNTFEALHYAQKDLNTKNS